MAVLAAFSLSALHILYTLALFIYSGWKSCTRASPYPLETAQQRSIPKHIAIILVTDPSSSREALEKTLMDTVVKAVGWCRIVGIQKLTVYEEHGRLVDGVHRIRELFSSDSSEHDSSESEIDYPPTPPPSDYSESPPLFPQNANEMHFGMHTETMHIGGTKIQRSCESGQGRPSLGCDSVPQKPLLLCLASRQSSKQAIANVAGLFASRHNRKSRRTAKHNKKDSFKLSIDTLDASLEADDGLSSPDLIIVHHTHVPHTPLELHGFPPWHIRLTEIYHNTIENPQLLKWLIVDNSSSDTAPLDELGFRKALDQFAAAEMRFGR